MVKVVLFGIGRNYYNVKQFIFSRDIQIIELWDNDFSKTNIVEEGMRIRTPHDGFVLNNDISIVVLCDNCKTMEQQLLSLGYSSDRIHDLFWIYRNRMLKFYEDCLLEDESEALALEYVRCNGLSIFNSDMPELLRKDANIDQKQIYVLHNNNRMYFPSKYSLDGAELYYAKLLREQSFHSTHNYSRFVEDFHYDCVVDAGSCEGIFAIDMLERSNEIYMIECDSDWTQMYKYTFGQYIEENKVIVCEKFLSDNDKQNNIKIDTLLEKYINETNKKILIKMDIEGAEECALLGGTNLLKSKNDITIIACVYHHFDSEEKIRKILADNGFMIHESHRSMFFPPEYEKNTVDQTLAWKTNELKNYRLRRGVIAGIKKNDVMQ